MLDSVVGKWLPPGDSHWVDMTGRDGGDDVVAIVVPGVEDTMVVVAVAFQL
jgi:hypothetical protein